VNQFNEKGINPLRFPGLPAQKKAGMTFWIIPENYLNDF